MRLFIRHGGWIGLIALLIGACAIYAWVAIGTNTQTLRSDGIDTTATIVDKSRVTAVQTINRAVGLSQNYDVTVRFSTGSAMDKTLRIHMVDNFVSRGFYNHHQVGDRIPIRYQPTDPSLIELEAGGTQGNSNAAGWVALGMFGLGGAGLALTIRAMQRTLRIERHGIPVIATVAEVFAISQTDKVVLRLSVAGVTDDIRTLPVRRCDLGDIGVGAQVDVRRDPNRSGLAQLVLRG